MTRCMMICLLVLLSIPTGASAQSCSGNPVAVQILGSGGRKRARTHRWAAPQAPASACCAPRVHVNRVSVWGGASPPG